MGRAYIVYQKRLYRKAYMLSNFLRSPAAVPMEECRLKHMAVASTIHTVLHTSLKHFENP
jgi:hypothetical protein